MAKQETEIDRQIHRWRKNKGQGRYAWQTEGRMKNIQRANLIKRKAKDTKAEPPTAGALGTRAPGRQSDAWARVSAWVRARELSWRRKNPQDEKPNSWAPRAGRPGPGWRLLLHWPISGPHTHAHAHISICIYTSAGTWKQLAAANAIIEMNMNE